VRGNHRGPLRGLLNFAVDIGRQKIGYPEERLVTTHVLILCTHNSARSVLAEGMLNHFARKLGQDVRAHSAGSAPSGRINPLAIEALSHAGIDTEGFRSKSWDEFTTDQAPPLSIVITVCDSAAAEVCPVFFGGAGQPVKVHWGYPDPSNAEGGEEGKRRAFELTRQAIGYRMLQLLSLPLDAMDRTRLHEALMEISKS
jgi:arsenate reductase (thioredoxin)